MEAMKLDENYRQRNPLNLGDKWEKYLDSFDINRFI